MLNIISGKLNRAQKVVIYGSEGIGKSTLAAQFPSALFIDTEGGADHMDVRRISRPIGWDELIADVNEVAKTPGVCGSLVLDTADWAEQMCITHICSKYKKSGLEEFGYGKGYTYLSEEFSRLLSALDEVIAAGINVVITAHAKMRKFELPDEMGSYDRWEMKLSKQVAPLLKEWCDMLLFLNYKTFVVSTESNTKKAQGGKRVMYATHHPCWDAKNRHGLPDEMEMDFSAIAHLFEGTAPNLTAYDKLSQLLNEARISEADIRRVVAGRGHFAETVPITEYPEDFITGWIIKNFTQLVKLINKDNGGNENE